MMAVEKNQSDVSRLADRNVLIGEEDSEQNIRFSISIAQLIEAALEREIANKPKRTILVTSRRNKDDKSDSPQSSSSNAGDAKSGEPSRLSPALGIEEEIHDMKLVSGEASKDDQEGPASPPRLPIKLVMKNRYRLPQETDNQQDVLDLSTSTQERQESVLRLATSVPKPSTSTRVQTLVDINPVNLGTVEENSAGCMDQHSGDLKMDVLDYHMVRSLSSIESSSYIAKNKNVRTKLTSAHKNYLKYSELVERIIEKKMEPTPVDSNGNEDDNEAGCRPASGVKRQLSSGEEPASYSDTLLNTKSARCDLDQVTD